MRAAVVGGGVIGMASAFALLDVADSVEVLDAGVVGGGASAGNTGWVSPSIATPLAAPGVLTLGLRSALDPRGALVIRKRLRLLDRLVPLGRCADAAPPQQISQSIGPQRLAGPDQIGRQEDRCRRRIVHRHIAGIGENFDLDRTLVVGVRRAATDTGSRANNFLSSLAAT